MTRGRGRRRFAAVKRQLLIAILALGLVLIAVAGWTVDGVRWALGGGSAGQTAPRAA
jgi:hypothetical protein